MTYVNMIRTFDCGVTGGAGTLASDGVRGAAAAAASREFLLRYLNAQKKCSVSCINKSYQRTKKRKKEHTPVLTQPAPRS